MWNEQAELQAMKSSYEALSPEDKVKEARNTLACQLVEDSPDLMEATRTHVTNQNQRRCGNVRGLALQRYGTKEAVAARAKSMVDETLILLAREILNTER